MKAIVMAVGEVTRLRPLILDEPKNIVEIPDGLLLTQYFKDFLGIKMYQKYIYNVTSQQEDI